MRVLILTKSAKNGGHCVAGINLSTRQWVRLITDNEEVNHSLTDENMICDNGKVCEKLDVVDVALLGDAPFEHQPENKLIDERVRFHFCYSYESIDQAIHHLGITPVSTQYIYGNTYSCITEEKINRLNYSLCLVRVQNVNIQNSEFTGKRNKVGFHYGNNVYDHISMTDRDYYFHDSPDNIPEAYIVVSLPSVPYERNNRYYKFVSAIYPAAG